MLPSIPIYIHSHQTNPLYRIEKNRITDQAEQKW